MEFRKDINGLRAIAVIAVVFYHFGLQGFGGGFVGVDIFFVLSGFLMAGLILGKLQTGNFSLKDFYISRARRIVPALAFLCTILAIIGWFWLPPIDYKQLGLHISSSLTFISNFIYKDEDGYFDIASEYKWLVHTWSLSVEWQFYLLFPLLLMALGRKKSGKNFPLQKITFALLLITLGFFIFSATISPIKTSMAFFLLPARIWELTAGALAYIAVTHHPQIYTRFSSLLFALGFLMIIGGIFLYDGLIPWPGHAALLPVLGTVFIILANKNNNPVLGNPVAQYLGLWSYSIYLWHWPIFVLLNYMNLSDNLFALSLGIGFSLLLGALSTEYIEKPFRRSKTNAQLSPLLKQSSIAFFIVLVLGGFFIHQADGFKKRVPDSIIEISNIRNDSEFRLSTCDKEGEKYQIHPSHLPCEENKTPSYIIWGDSHAISGFFAAHEASNHQYGISISMSCIPLLNAYLVSRRDMSACEGFVENSLARFAKYPSSVPLILSFRLSYYLHGFNEKSTRPVVARYKDIEDSIVDKNKEPIFQKRLVETLCKIREEQQRPLYVIKPTPEMKIEVPKILTARLMLPEFIKSFVPQTDVLLSRQEHDERHKAVYEALNTAKEECGIGIIDPIPYLCDEEFCRGSIEKTPLYYDDDHLSRAGSLRIAPAFKGVFE